MPDIQHSDIPPSDCHNSKATTFTGSPASYAPPEAGILVIRTDVTPNVLYRTTGTSAGNVVQIGEVSSGSTVGKLNIVERVEVAAFSLATPPFYEPANWNPAIGPVDAVLAWEASGADGVLWIAGTTFSEGLGWTQSWLGTRLKTTPYP